MLVPEAAACIMAKFSQITVHATDFHVPAVQKNDDTETHVLVFSDLFKSIAKNVMFQPAALPVVYQKYDYYQLHVLSYDFSQQRRGAYVMVLLFGIFF